MGWSQVVHDNRKKAELQRAREELKLRRRGYELEVSGSPGSFFIYMPLLAQLEHSLYHCLVLRAMVWVNPTAATCLNALGLYTCSNPHD
jgi:hypothetical protein